LSVFSSNRLFANLFAYLGQGQDKAEGQTTKEFKYKLAVAVRRDLEMGKGKIAVQVGHASVTASEETRRRRPEWWKAWFEEGQCKVVVKVNSENELEALSKDAEDLGLVATIIHDSGLTQVAPGTATCVGIGPAPAELVDKITGELPLL
jgi:PTH2 family peptidyl-tRNA hydrolase